MKVWCTTIVCFTVFFGCVDDAPRDNPLDPLSPRYTSRGSLTGRTVFAGLATATGVTGAIVSHVESGTFVITDSMGYFTFNNLPLGMQHFTCVKQNFTGDTFQVQIQSYPPANIVRGLNGAPVVLSQRILTRKSDYVQRTPQYFVDVDAHVIDPNGSDDFTLNSVWFAVVDTSARDTFFRPMPYVSDEKFAVMLEQTNFPTNTIQWLTGKELHIVATDRNMAVGISAPFYISRIIENASTPFSPSSYENVSLDTLVFKWKPPDVTFNYTSTVEVYRLGIDNAELIQAGLISIYEQYPSDGITISLTPGVYFWTVTIVDDFGNSSRSKESYFTVQ